MRPVVHCRYMAKAKSIDEKIDSLTQLVEKGFAALADDIAQRPTKAEVSQLIDAKLDLKLAPVISELTSIRRDLDDLRRKVENVIGYRKEIDHALDRIAAIEKHLGIRKPAAS